MKKLLFLCGCTLINSLSLPNLICMQQKMIVSVPIADLRSKPVPVPEGAQAPALSKNLAVWQDSQVLFAECVWGEDIPGEPDWVKVSTPGQKAWRDNKWVGYPGYILRACLLPVSEFPKYNIVLQNLWTPVFSDMDIKSDILKELALGTRLEAKRINDGLWWEVVVDGKIDGYIKHNNGIYELTENVTESEDQLRKQIVETAYLFKSSGSSYVWGGRSPLNAIVKNQVTGVDCSGLTNLCYQAWGFEIPRDAGPQFRSINRLASGKDLRPADLIFFARDEQGTRVSHVIIYVGNGKIIECSGHDFTSVNDVYNPEINKDLEIKFEDFFVREKDIKHFTGVNVSEIESGKTRTLKGGYVFLGSYFGPENKIQTMRKISLGQNISW